jgi:prepilin-type processing-associated H-X9-DG protein
MKPNRTVYFRAAFTLVEMLVLIAIIALLGLLFYPRLLNEKEKAQRIRCTSHLKQVGLAFRSWAGDHDDKNPFHISVTNGGTKEFIATGETFRHFEVMSNELNTPKILVCPTDKQRVAADRFTSALNNNNVSYFVGIDAEDSAPDRFLAGDRNILGGTVTGTNLVEFSSTNGVGWGSDLHKGQGNVGLADGSVQGFSSSALRKGLVNTGLATNRLAMP